MSYILVPIAVPMSCVCLCSLLISCCLLALAMFFDIEGMGSESNGLYVELSAR